MKKLLLAALSFGLINGALASTALAADCPPELANAQVALKTAQAALKSSRTAKMQDVQAPRAQAGARAKDVQASKMQDVQAPKMQDVQAPKMQDVQAPKMQDVQAPKMQDVQAPKMQDVQAPKMQDVQAPKVNKARALVRQAEQACKKGDMTASAVKAKEALALLK